MYSGVSRPRSMRARPLDGLGTDGLLALIGRRSCPLVPAMICLTLWTPMEGAHSCGLHGSSLRLADSLRRPSSAANSTDRSIRSSGKKPGSGAGESTGGAGGKGEAAAAGGFSLRASTATPAGTSCGSATLASGNVRAGAWQRCGRPPGGSIALQRPGMPASRRFFGIPVACDTSGHDHERCRPGGPTRFTSLAI